MHRRLFCQAVIAGFWGACAQSALGIFPSRSIRWQENLRTAHHLAVQAQRPLLIVFTATWCHYCHKLIRESLSDRALVTYIERQFIPTLLDYDREQRIARILEVDALPCLLVLSPQADLLIKQQGYAKSSQVYSWLQTALQRQQEIQMVAAQN
ncbi:MAG: hypothetical protein KatS3mg113_0430 [Planctomycetaceae bacterium]|nr:MAG: hypothetical protein KatS3mg113_0430 [Planctomycetaceae bacterium]